MDDTNQKQTPMQSGQTSQQTPVSGPAKEQAPIEAPVGEYVQPTEQAPVLAPEVKEAGVEHAPSSEQPQLPPDAVQAGIEHAKEALLHPTQPAGTVQLPPLPMTPQEVQTAVKGPVSSSKTWVAKLTEFVMKQLHIPL